MYGGRTVVFDSDYRQVTAFTAEHWPEGDEKWLYTGSLFIDDRFLDDVCNAILNARYRVDGWETARSDPAWQETAKDTDQFQESNVPVTFADCGARPVYDVAKRWLSLLRQQSDVTNHLKTRVTSCDTGTLEVSGAAYSDRAAATYEHTLRDHLIDARSHFYGESVQVDYARLFHAADDRECNDALADHIDKLQDPLTGFGDPRFISNDHRAFEHGTDRWQTAHLLQLADVVTSAVANLFTSEHLGHRKEKLAWLLRDMVQGSMDYDEAADRCTIAFYPKENSSGTQEFYYWRDIKRKDPHKQSLDRFL